MSPINGLVQYRLRGAIASVVLIACVGVAAIFTDVRAQENLPIVGISKFQATANASDYYRYSSSNPQNFEVMLETQLMKIGRFKIYERNRLDQVLGEQAIQQSLSGNGTILKVDGVDYLLYGAITEFGSAVNEINAGSFSARKVTTRFGVDVKIVDARTGELRRAETVTVTAEGGNAVSTGDFRQSAGSDGGLVDAQRKAAKIVASLLTESIFPISVVEVSGADVYINYGDSILTVGDELRVIKQGKQLIDPQSGKTLGSTETLIARIKIREATKDFSIAEIIEGAAPASGDLARLDLKAAGEGAREQRRPLGRKL